MASVIHIDDQRYELDGSTDVHALEDEIVAAARLRADFVAVPCVDRPPVEVLITDATAVRVEPLTPTSASAGSDASWDEIDRLYRDL